MLTSNAVLAGLATMAAIGWSQPPRILAQRLVDEIKAAHPEISSLEVAASRSAAGGCKTIAATEAKEVGQKCDKDELTAIKTNRPFIEQEKTEFDATMPLHDSTGAVIGTAGMDFKMERGLTKTVVEQRARRIVSEFEARIRSRDDLFRPE